MNNNNGNNNTSAIHIPTMYDQHEINRLESYVINEIKLSGLDIRIPKNHYYLEAVGQWLYNNDRDRLALYILPLTDRILRSNTKYLNGLAYEDVFQSLVLFSLKKLKTYNPEMGKLFTYFTQNIQFHLKTITINHYNKKDDLTSISNLEISHVNNGQEILMEFLSFLNQVKNRKTLSEEYRLIYHALYDIIITEKNLHPLTSNPTYTLARKTGLKKDDPRIREALDELSSEYGSFNFKNNIQVYRNDMKNENE